MTYSGEKTLNIIQTLSSALTQAFDTITMLVEADKDDKAKLQQAYSSIDNLTTQLADLDTSVAQAFAPVMQQAKELSAKISTLEPQTDETPEVPPLPNLPQVDPNVPPVGGGSIEDSTPV